MIMGYEGLQRVLNSCGDLLHVSVFFTIFIANNNTFYNTLTWSRKKEQ